MRERILGVVLAGGLSSRMGREKALVELAGRPLLAHVLERLGPQVGQMALNANGDPGRFARFGLEVVPDGHAGNPGPLAGLSAALALGRRRGFEIVATVPSDAPFLPSDAVRRLTEALDSSAQAAVASGPNGLEPLVGVWRVDVGAAIDKALADGRRAVRQLLASIPHRVVPFGPDPSGVDPFANLNTPGDLEAAARTLGA